MTNESEQAVAAFFHAMRSESKRQSRGVDKDVQKLKDALDRRIKREREERGE